MTTLPAVCWCGRPSPLTSLGRAGPRGRSSRISRSAKGSPVRCVTAPAPTRATTTSAYSSIGFRTLSERARAPCDWEYTPVGDPRWLSVLPQDFSNVAAVQQGMKSAGFPAPTQPLPRAQLPSTCTATVRVRGHRRQAGPRSAFMKVSTGTGARTHTVGAGRAGDFNSPPGHGLAMCGGRAGPR